jgi:hypothetical protein
MISNKACPSVLQRREPLSRPTPENNKNPLKLPSPSIKSNIRLASSAPLSPSLSGQNFWVDSL